MKTLLLSIAALLLCTSLYAQQWEKIQYPEVYESNPKIRRPDLVVNNNIIYALSSRDTIPLYYSKDNGSTWQATDIISLKLAGRNSIGIYAIIFTRSSLIVASNTGLIRSLDNGQTWEKVDFFPYVKNTLDTNIRGITAYNETVIVKTGITNNINAYISTDEGTTWKEMGLPKNIFDSFGKIKVYKNSLMYEGQFYDGKELSNKGYEGRFYLIQDINNPISQKLTNFPTLVDFSNKSEDYYPCDRLSIVGDYFTCNGDIVYIDGNWRNRATIQPSPIELMKDIEYYNIPYQTILYGDNNFIESYFNILGQTYDTYGNIFYNIIVRRKSDSARVHRFVRQSHPYNGNFDIIADDFIVMKNLPNDFVLLTAVTDKAVIIRNSNGLYRFQKSSVSVEEEIQNANNTMTLQPHPAKDQINIRFTTPQNGLYHCELHDMMGAKIVSLGMAPLQKGQQWNLDADIHSVPNGYFRVIIKSPTQVFSVPCLIHK